MPLLSDFHTWKPLIMPPESLPHFLRGNLQSGNPKSNSLALVSRVVIFSGSKVGYTPVLTSLYLYHRTTNSGRLDPGSGYNAINTAVGILANTCQASVVPAAICFPAHCKTDLPPCRPSSRRLLLNVLFESRSSGIEVRRGDECSVIRRASSMRWSLLARCGGFFWLGGVMFLYCLSSNLLTVDLVQRLHLFTGGPWVQRTSQSKHRQ